MASIGLIAASVARVRASHRVENFQRDCLGCFCRFELLAGRDAWLAQVCDLRLVAARKGIVKSLLG
jgi:ubiquitin C-terminal hydrolase